MCVRALCSSCLSVAAFLLFLGVKDGDKVFHGGATDDQLRELMLLLAGAFARIFGGGLFLFACTFRRHTAQSLDSGNISQAQKHTSDIQ